MNVVNKIKEIPEEILGNWQDFHNQSGHPGGAKKCEKCLRVYNNPDSVFVPAS